MSQFIIVVTLTVLSCLLHSTHSHNILVTRVGFCFALTLHLLPSYSFLLRQFSHAIHNTRRILHLLLKVLLVIEKFDFPLVTIDYPDFN